MSGIHLQYRRRHTKWDFIHFIIDDLVQVSNFNIHRRPTAKRFSVSICSFVRSLLFVCVAADLVLSSSNKDDEDRNTF